MLPHMASMIPCSNCGHLEQLSSRFDPVSVDNLRQPLEELDLEIANIEGALDKLKSRKALLKRRVNRLVAPILRLSPDILCSEIFLRCIDDVWKIHSSRISVPFTLGSICGAWRDLTLSTPWLWNKVSVDLDRSSASRCALLEGWLARSSDYPLSIQLRGGLHHTPFITEALDIISRFSERWHRIDFRVAPEWFETLAGIQTRLPLLTSVVLKGDYNYQKIQLFSAAPQLREVTLIDLQLTQVTLPMTQLTRLTIPIYSDVEECLNTLRCAPRLGACVLNFSTIIQLRNVLLPMVMPQVESLELRTRQANVKFISHLMDAFSLPSTHSLKFIMEFSLFPHMNFVSLINRSSCSLTRLELSCVVISDIHLLQCLQVVPLLSVLALDYTSVEASIFRMLNPNHASDFGYTGPLLPNLQTFVYIAWPDDISLDGDVIDMLCSRWNSNDVAGLRFVTITTRNPSISNTGTKELMQHLISQGMEIRVSSMLH
jgi:hypothetical protein